MRRVLLTMLALLVPFVGIKAQTPLKVLTSPKLPAREALERMNLTLAWNTRAEVDGTRDGIFSLQLLPGTPNQLVAQTYKGAVHLYNADNGDLIWKTNVGVAYWVSQPVGFNSQSIFVTRRDRMHILNRFTGEQRVYSLEPGTKLLNFGTDLQFTPSAPPVADEEFVYVCLGSRVHAFVVPDFAVYERIKRAREARKASGKLERPGEDKLPFLEEMPATDSMNSLQPILFWSFAIPAQVINEPPLFSGDQISIILANGVLTSVNRYDRGPRIENYEFKFNGDTLGGGGQHGRNAYVGAEDFNLYALDMPGGKLLWRHLSGAPIPRKPQVNDHEIFLAPTGVGLRCLDRVSGREKWTNRDTQRFLATNNQYVYARDNLGKFFVLDGRRGATLAKYDLSEWTISIANEWTDRVFLAANDGQIMCLRHRDLAKPMFLKTTYPLPPPMEVEKKVEKKKDEKGDEKKEDPEKKDAVRAGGLSYLTQPPTMPISTRLASAWQIEHGTADVDDRRTWMSR